MSSEKWFADYFSSIYSYILLQVKDSHIAEDLTQETFLKVVSKEHQFKGQSSIKTWIFRIAYTTTMSYFRKRNPLSYYFDTEYLSTKHNTSPEEITLLNSQQKQFYESLNKLKPSYQQVIILRRIQGFSTKEAASILHCSEGKVKMSLSRALTAFKKELEKGGFTNETLIR